MKRWGAVAALLLAFALALALRVPHLSVRPLHNDEAVNATKVAELWEHGRYAYDPDEYHGPTLDYATLPILWMSGARNSLELRDSFLRAAPVAFGAALILLLWLVRDGFGDKGMVWAATLTAISPGMVFYSRYFIHEMLLVFFTGLALAALWRYTRKPGWGWAAVAGASVGLMFATKETFVIPVAAAVCAAVATKVWFRSTDSHTPTTGQGFTPIHKIPWIQLGVAIAAGVVVWILFFSSFFTNWHGLGDSIRTYLPWLKRAGGKSPHIHPWYFYLQRLGWFHVAKGPIWSEGLILFFAAVGGTVALKRRNSTFACFLTFYTVALTAAYSIISYKTPWCALGFLHGMILLAGMGIAVVVERFRWVVVVVAIAAAQLGVQAWQLNTTYAADRRNPYVYAQTSADLLNLVERVNGIARASGASDRTIIKVITANGDYWPLPWYLRRFQNVGWYDKVPEDAFAPMMIVQQRLDARYDEKSDRKWIMVGMTELRPKVFLELYVELELWKKYLATTPRPKDDD